MGVRVLWPPECSDDILAGCIEETLRTLEVYEIAKDGNKVFHFSYNYFIIFTKKLNIHTFLYLPLLIFIFKKTDIIVTKAYIIKHDIVI